MNNLTLRITPTRQPLTLRLASPVSFEATALARITPGPGSGGTTPTLLSDYTGPQYAYLGYTGRIVRIDYAQSQPISKSAQITDLPTSWPTRAGLIYT